MYEGGAGNPRILMKTNKLVIVAAIAGLLGGGVAYGGASFIHNQMESSNTAVPTGSNTTGTTKTSNVKVNVSSQSSKAFSTIKDSVVSVINLQKANTNDSDSIISSIFGNESSSSSKSSSSSSELETASEGSGVIYKKSGDTAYIVTNNHVVSGSSSLEIIMSNGKKLPAKIVGTDSVTDLAVLKINSSAVTDRKSVV